MFKARKYLVVAVLLAAGCRQRSPQQESAVKDAQSGPAAVRPSWLLSPEQIESTVRDTWGLTVNDADAQTYFGSVHTLMGGTSVVRRTALMNRPHELFVLTIDSLSAWTAAKLIEKQSSAEKTAGAPDQYLFRGFSLSGLNPSDKISDPVQCQACYADDTKPWCDCADGVTVGGLGTASLTPDTLAANANPGAAQWRKRVMHNMQDIGDFLMCGVASIDDQTPAVFNGQNMSISQYLLDDVFLPTWNRELVAGTAAPAAEGKAWAGVVHAILVGQACFMDLMTAQN